LNKINEAVHRVNKIMFHTYNFLKLVFIEFANHRDLEFPTINRTFIDNIIKFIVGKEAFNDPNPNLKQFIGNVYKSYKTLCPIDKDLHKAYIHQILSSQVVDLIKNIENNISMHYVKHVKTYVNLAFDLKGRLDAIKNDKTLTKDQKKESRNQVYKYLSDIKNDLLDTRDFMDIDTEQWALRATDDGDREWIIINRKFLVPDKHTNSFKYAKTDKDRNSIAYDVASKPLDYLRGMIERQFTRP
jgi:hypothetical protein